MNTREITDLKTVLENPFAFIEDKTAELNDDTVSNLFRKIADYLIKNVVITIGKDCYSFVEIEFYYYKDNSSLNGPMYYCTYPRERNAMQFFTHNSGIDICFKSSLEKNNMEFGGILIRTIKKEISEEEYEIIAGPMRCAIELMNNSFNKGTLPKLEELNVPKDLKIESTIRYGIEDVIKERYPEIKKKYDEKTLPLFCYYVPQKTWTRSYKKRIIKDSKNGGYKESLKDYYGAIPNNRIK